MLPVSCLLFAYFFFFFSETFFLMLVNLVYYLELLYFKLEAVFFEGGLWCYFDLLELWSAFPSLRVTEGTIQNCVQRTSKQKISRTFQSSFCWLAFFPLVLQFLFCKLWVFFSDFSTPFQSDLQNCPFLKKRVPFALFFPHWY